MKGILIAISGTIILMSSMVHGQSDTQVNDPRQMNQEDWIERSFDRGQFNHRETVQLDREQGSTDRLENRKKTDEAMTKKKAKQIGAKQKRSPRPIVRERPARHGVQHR